MPYKAMFSIVFLPIILFIGLITSWEDFTDSKIRNKWVLAGLIYSCVVYLVSLILCPSAESTAYYLIWNFDKWCINLLISVIAGYLLWRFKMWGAGDAKLFACYAALIPMGQYSKAYFNYYFVSFLLLLSIFIPATIFLAFKSVIHFVREFKFNIAKARFNKSNGIEMLKILLGFIVFFLFFRIVSEKLGNLFYKIFPNQNIILLFPLLVFPWLSKIFKKNAKSMVWIFAGLLAYMGLKIVYSWQQFIIEMGNIFGKTMLLMFLFFFVQKIIDLYEERTVKKTMPFAPWMFLGVLITWFLR